MNSIKNLFRVGSVLIFSVVLSSCSGGSTATPQQAAGTAGMKNTLHQPVQPKGLPVQYQTAAYVVGKADSEQAKLSEETALKVGARITSTKGPQPLWDIVMRLVALKGMNVSWASDVDREVLVDVDINADDDFYTALDNLLRQVDYYHKVEGNTVVVKFRETRQFQIAMPFTKHKYNTSVGGDILGNSGEGQIRGSITLESKDNDFDLWKTVQENLDIILQVWEIKQGSAASGSKSNAGQIADGNGENGSNSQGSVSPGKSNNKKNNAQGENNGSEDEIVSAESSGGRKHSENAKGYYVIDKPVGIITVTAPRPVLEKVDQYVTNLKKTLYKQIAIEAKIIEVQLDKESNIGIDWSNVMKNYKLLAGTLTFGANGQVYPYIRSDSSSPWMFTDIEGKRTFSTGGNLDAIYGEPYDTGKKDKDGNKILDLMYGGGYYNSIDPGQFISKVTLGAANFDLFVSALKEEGQTKILSNPKISVMNGQPAMISVGQNRTYIDSLDVEVDDDTGDKTYSAATTSLLAGIGMAITATILDDKEVIMNLVPITSELVGGAIPYENIGASEGRVGVPILNVREMSTTVKVKDGEMLVIGGLISDAETSSEDFIPGLGSIPVVKYLFGKESKKKRKRELIILLRPKII